MNVKDIPYCLFMELMERVGRGPSYQGVAMEDNLGGGLWQLCEIDPAKYGSGNPDIIGVIGYLGPKHEGWIQKFAIWSTKPRGETDCIGEPLAILVIAAGTQTGNSWALGIGSSRHEFIKAEFALHGVNLTNYLTPLVSAALRRANELTKECPPPARYWEGDVTTPAPRPLSLPLK